MPLRALPPNTQNVPSTEWQTSPSGSTWAVTSPATSVLYIFTRMGCLQEISKLFFFNGFCFHYHALTKYSKSAKQKSDFKGFKAFPLASGWHQRPYVYRWQLRIWIQEQECRLQWWPSSLQRQLSLGIVMRNPFFHWSKGLSLVLIYITICWAFISDFVHPFFSLLTQENIHKGSKAQSRWAL